jgi:hypothetical protein
MARSASGNAIPGSTRRPMPGHACTGFERLTVYESQCRSSREAGPDHPSGPVQEARLASRFLLRGRFVR